MSKHGKPAREFDPVSDTGAVPSPCINICQMDPRTGQCAGCLRTLEEIAMWSEASDSAKRAIWVELKRRKENIKSGAGSLTPSRPLT